MLVGGLSMLARVIAVLAFAFALVPAQARELAIVNATLLASPTSEPVDNATVLVSGGRIIAAGRALAPPAGADVLDAKGRFVCAGFWNSHVHLLTPVLVKSREHSDPELSQELSRDFLRWGFTTVFDLASTTDVALAIRHRIDAGRVTGPNIMTVGDPFYPRGGTPVYAREFYREYGLPSAEIDSTAEALDRVQRQASAGTNGVKLLTGAIVGGADGVLAMRADDVRAIAEAAHRLGQPVFAHPTNREGLGVAVDNGADVLAHAAPLTGAWDDALVQELVRRHVALIPTLALFEEFPDPSTPVGVAVDQVKSLARAGGVVLFGTDAGFSPNFDPSREYELLERALGWRGILAALTVNPATRFLGRPSAGTVAPGEAADLVILCEDPRRAASNFAKVAAVVKAGRRVGANPCASPSRSPAVPKVQANGVPG